MAWVPPGRDCGACGSARCGDFLGRVGAGEKALSDCPYYTAGEGGSPKTSSWSGTDILGNAYDFVLQAFPGEPSARKSIVPFRADLVERWEIRPGEIVTGRPAGPGCPVYHALRVISANPVTGVLECHTVGPLAARKEQGKVHDVQAYHVHAFEGIAEVRLRPPVLGARQRFLPGYCMMDLSHTAVVNMVLHKKEGVHVRLEDIRIQ
ncbi:MAG TPA: (Fe-S)-binding protein [Methanoregula sp.]|nr:(Fe-S)-binding protein [Methanoregula sp.]